MTLGDASQVRLRPGTPSSTKPSLITSTLKLEVTRSVLELPDTSSVRFL